MSVDVQQTERRCIAENRTPDDHVTVMRAVVYGRSRDRCHGLGWGRS
jgi:hypothetical protein